MKDSCSKCDQISKKLRIWSHVPKKFLMNGNFILCSVSMYHFNVSVLSIWTDEILSAIMYHLYNFKNVKNTHGGVLLLIKFQALACKFTKSNTPRWVFFTFFKLYEWYQIPQRITDNCLQQRRSQNPIKRLRQSFSHQ